MNYTWVDRFQGKLHIHLIVQDEDLSNVIHLCDLHGVQQQFHTVCVRGEPTDLHSGMLTLHTKQQETLFRLMGDADTKWPA